MFNIAQDFNLAYTFKFLMYVHPVFNFTNIFQTAFCQKTNTKTSYVNTRYVEATYNTCTKCNMLVKLGARNPGWGPLIYSISFCYWFIVKKWGKPYINYCLTNDILLFNFKVWRLKFDVMALVWFVDKSPRSRKPIQVNSLTCKKSLLVGKYFTFKTLKKLGQWTVCHPQFHKHSNIRTKCFEQHFSSYNLWFFSNFFLKLLIKYWRNQQNCTKLYVLVHKTRSYAQL